MMAGDEKANQIKLGDHTVVFEPPDLIFVTFRGVIRAKEAATYVMVRDELSRGASSVLTLVGVREAVTFEPAARKIVAEVDDARPTATAIYGGSFAFRVVADMVSHAARIVAKRKLTTNFFADEPSARAWLAEMRDRFQAG